MTLTPPALNEDYFKEYKKLGGKKNRKEYDINLDIFLDHTLEIYVYGNTTKHDTRSKAGYAVMKEAKITVEEYNLIFESVNNITSYTWGFKMIRPELHTFKFSPKTKSKEDLKLIKDLEQLVKTLDLSKTQLTRMALNNLVNLKLYGADLNHPLN